MTAMRPWMLGASILIVIGLGAYWMFRPAPVSVTGGVVSYGPLTVLVEEQGRTRAQDPYRVAAPVTGRLLRSRLKAGDKVGAGEMIARIALPPDDLRTEAVSRANLVAAQAREAAARAALMEAQGAQGRTMKEAERRQELYKNKLTSAEDADLYQQAADSAQAHLLSMRAALQAAQAEVASARSWLMGINWNDEAGIMDVTAPVDGTVYRIHEDSERVVQAGTPLYEISNDDALELVVDLLTQDAVQVKPGAAIYVSGWGGDRVLTGTVRYVEPEAFTRISALGVEEQRVNVIGAISEPVPGLGAQYRIDAGIVVWEADRVLRVPISAVFQRDKTWQVFVVEEGRAQRREISLGHRNREFAEVLAGLTEGTVVVEFPSDLVVDAMPVAVEQGEMPR